MASGVWRFFAALVLSHATTSAAPVLAMTPMGGAAFSTARESVRHVQRADFNSMRSNTFLANCDNNVGQGQNKAEVMKTGGANAAQGNDQIQPDARANFGNTHWSESCSATSMQWCNLNNTCCMVQRTGDGEYEGGKRAMARLRGSTRSTLFCWSRGYLRRLGGGSTPLGLWSRPRVEWWRGSAECEGKRIEKSEPLASGQGVRASSMQQQPEQRVLPSASATAVAQKNIGRSRAARGAGDGYLEVEAELSSRQGRAGRAVRGCEVGRIRQAIFSRRLLRAREKL